MKLNILRALVFKKHLLKRMTTTCKVKNHKCGFHNFLDKLLDILNFGNLSTTKKKNVPDI